MNNSFSGVQLIAASGLQSGEGLAPPNISSNLSLYESIDTVNNFISIYNTSNTFPFGLTSENANLLMKIGSNSFPYIFGQVPYEYSDNLGFGFLFAKCYERTENWFGNSSTANVYIQALNQAQAYATTSKSILSSANSTQFVSNSAAITVTGGFSALAGNSISDFSTVSNTISELGTLMIPAEPYYGFSNVGCFQQILDSGYDTIGNLHLTFFGKNITDPITGNVWVIGSDLFNYVLDNPYGLSSDDTFQITALNPLDAIIGNVANAALTATSDLDAVVSYFSIGSNAASRIYSWNDCMNIPLLLGDNSTKIIENTIGSEINAYSFIKTLVMNISDLTSLSSMTDFGYLMYQLEPVENANSLLALTSPISANDYSNLKSMLGPGSGTYDNPTVNDILGSTNYNVVLYNTIFKINQISSNQNYVNINSDSRKISIALTNNVYPVLLSNGVTYNNVNDLAVGGSNLINLYAANLANTFSNIYSFDDYDNLAETHNNSIVLSSQYCSINTASIINSSNINQTAGSLNVSGLVGLILSIINKYYGASSAVNINNPSQPAVFQKIPGGIELSALSTFPSTVASMSSSYQSDPTSDEITGLNNVINCIDINSLTGQALNATIIEAKNNSILQSYGISSQSYSSKN